MKNKLIYGFTVGGILGLLLLSLNLVIPVFLAYIAGATQIVFYMQPWEMVFEPYLLLFMWLTGLFALIVVIRSK